MRYLLDSGILIRFTNPTAVEHSMIKAAIKSLTDEGHLLSSNLQTRSEFWSVCTRPLTARGGLGLTFEECLRRLETIEAATELLPDHPESYRLWVSLIHRHRVMGVQVHDTKIVSQMLAHGITHILTLNPKDFQRYQTLITVVTPSDVLSHT